MPGRNGRFDVRRQLCHRRPLRGRGPMRKRGGMRQQAPIVIKLTDAQKELFRQAAGNSVSALRVEPLAEGARWLYAANRGQEAWLLKHPEAEAYRSAKLKHQPVIDPRYAFFRMTAGPSAIHAVGVFAAERIPARRKVIEYTGERINPVEAHRRVKRAKKTYVFTVDKFWNVDGVVDGSGAEFINHSCDPNLKSRIVASHVMYHSIRPIAVGEELTVDYRFSSKAPKVRCRCGSPICRGTINVKASKA